MLSANRNRAFFQTVLIFIIIVLVASLSSCHKTEISVSITPEQADLTAGQQFQFTATVSNDSKNLVVWTASGGVIDQSGLYTAGRQAGTYRVVATSTVDKTKFAVATVRITVPEGTLLWHKWLASKDYETPSAMAVDNKGNVILAGNTDNKSIFATQQWSSYCFLAKYTKDGKELWHKWFGAKSNTRINNIFTNDTDDIFISGSTVESLFGEPAQGKDEGFVAKLDSGGQVIWHIWLSSKEEDYVDGISLDQKGNLYLIGSTKGLLFGEMAKGEWDAILLKYDSSGKKLWHSWFSSDKMDRLNHIAIDSKNAVYLSGISIGNMFSEPNQGEWDSFVVKLDEQGKEIWHKWLASGGDDFDKALLLDASDSLIVSIASDGPLLGHKNKGKTDTLIIKYDSKGKILWQKWLAGAGYQEIASLVLDKSNNLIVSGYSDDGLFGENNKGQGDGFLLKTNPAGQEVWHKWLSSAKADLYSSAVVDSTGKVFTVAYSESKLNLNSTQQTGNQYLIKFDQDGKKLWQKDLPPPGLESLLLLSTDASGHLYISASTESSFYGETNKGFADMFLAKYQ